MQEKPKTLIVASVVALIGAIIALVEAFLAFEVGGVSMELLRSIGVLLLVATLFFAIIGSFGITGQWSWRMSLIMSFACASVIIMSYLYEIIDLTICFMLLSTALITVAFTINGKEWMNSRVAPEVQDN